MGRVSGVTPAPTPDPSPEADSRCPSAGPPRTIPSIFEVEKLRHRKVRGLAENCTIRGERKEHRSCSRAHSSLGCAPHHRARGNMFPCSTECPFFYQTFFDVTDISLKQNYSVHLPACGKCAWKYIRDEAGPPPVSILLRLLRTRRRVRIGLDVQSPRSSRTGVRPQDEGGGREEGRKRGIWQDQPGCVTSGGKHLSLSNPSPRLPSAGGSGTCGELTEASWEQVAAEEPVAFGP